MIKCLFNQETSWRLDNIFNETFLFNYVIVDLELLATHKLPKTFRFEKTFS